MITCHKPADQDVGVERLSRHRFEDVFIRQIAARFGERHRFTPKLFEHEQCQLAPQGIPHDIAPFALDRRQYLLSICSSSSSSRMVTTFFIVRHVIQFHTERKDGYSRSVTNLIDLPRATA